MTCTPEQKGRCVGDAWQYGDRVCDGTCWWPIHGYCEFRTRDD